MTRYRLSEEYRDKYLQVLGPGLGPVFCALYDEVTWVHAKWLEYCKLYGHSPERVDLLNGTARFFFVVVEDVLRNDVLLHLARLVDPPQSVGKSNLTLCGLPCLVQESTLATKVQSLVDVAVDKCEFARDLRNRRLAHRDLALTLDRPAKRLPAVSRQRIDEALDACSAVLKAVEMHYFGAEVNFRPSLPQQGRNRWCTC